MASRSDQPATTAGAGSVDRGFRPMLTMSLVLPAANPGELVTSASAPKRTSNLAMNSCLDARGARSEGTVKIRLVSGPSSNCLPEKVGLNSSVEIALRATVPTHDRIYNRTVASAYTVATTS